MQNKLNGRSAGFLRNKKPSFNVYEDFIMKRRRQTVGAGTSPKIINSGSPLKSNRNIPTEEYLNRNIEPSPLPYQLNQ
jgi:hypothetical protein